MGCVQSNTEARAQSNCPDNFKDLNEVRSIPEVDPRIPLNMRQVFKLKQSWKGIKRNITEAGVEMFIR